VASAGGIRAGRAFVELGTDDKYVAGLSAAERRLKAFAAGVKELGRSLVKVSAAVLAPVALSTKTFASFEQQMARVKALRDATGNDFAALENEARRLGEQTVFSAKEAADAMAFFALAGFDVQKILKAAAPTLDLAAAGQLQMAEAADLTAKIMAGMGVEAEDVGYSVDVLTKAMTTALTTLAQLGDAMKFVGPLAKNAGISFEEVTAAIQILSNAGIQADLAGTSIRGVLLALTNPAADAQKVMSELGISVSDSSGNIRSMADIIQQFEGALNGLGTGKRLEIIGKIFDTRQATGFVELVTQGSDKLRAFTARLENSGGTAERIAKIQYNTLSGSLELLKSAAQELGIVVGKAVVGPLRASLHWITETVKVVNEWARKNQALIVSISASAVALGALGAALLGIGVAAAVAAPAFGALASVLSASIAGLGLLLSPLGLVSAGLVAGAGAFIYYSGVGGQALKWLGDQFKHLHEFTTGVLDGIADALAAGDIKLSAEVLWAGLAVAWEYGTLRLGRIWTSGMRFFLETFIDLKFEILKIWEAIINGAEIAHRKTVGRITEALIDAQELAGILTSAEADYQKDVERKDREAEIARLSVEGPEAKEQLDREKVEALAKIKDAADAQVKAAELELEAAKAALKSAQEKAKADRKLAESKISETPPAPGRPSLDLAGGGLDAALGRISTFNVGLVSRLVGGGSDGERTAQATADAAKTLRSIDDRMRRSRGLVFA